MVQPDAVLVRHDDVWERYPTPEGTRFRAASVGEERGQVVIYAIGGGASGSWIVRGSALHISEDMGRTWRAGDESLPALACKSAASEPPTLTSVGCSARHAATAYLGFDGLRTGEGPENLFGGYGHRARPGLAGRGVYAVRRGLRHWGVEVHRRRPILDFEE